MRQPAMLLVPDLDQCAYKQLVQPLSANPVCARLCLNGEDGLGRDQARHH
jgi:hypothetical protein